MKRYLLLIIFLIVMGFNGLMALDAFSDSNCPFIFEFDDGELFAFKFKCDTVYDTTMYFNFHTTSKIILHNVIYYLSILPLDSTIKGDFCIILGKKELFYKEIEQD